MDDKFFQKHIEIAKKKASTLVHNNLNLFNEPILWCDLTFDAMRWLGKSLLYELQTTTSDEVLNELAKLLDEMIEIAQEQKSFLLLTEVYLLKAKLALINMNFQEFESILKQAEHISEEKGMTGI